MTTETPETTPETPTQAQSRTDVNGVPFADYIRSLTFVDPIPDDGTAEPVHVGAALLINGEPTDVRVNLVGGYSISGGDQGTIVSFLVHPEDCHIGRIARIGDGEEQRVDFDLPTIGGRLALTPFPSPMWSTEHVIDPYRTRSVERWPVAFDDNDQVLCAWVRVHLYVSEVSCVRAPHPDPQADPEQEQT